MKLEEIFALWDEDVNVSPVELGTESLKIPKIHNKYYRIYSEEKMLLEKFKADYKKLYKDKLEYYRGELDDVTMKEYGWEPLAMRILKTDVPTYIEADNDIIKLTLKIALQKEKVDVLHAIIDSVMKRSFLINSAIEDQKFKAGEF